MEIHVRKHWTDYLTPAAHRYMFRLYVHCSIYPAFRNFQISCRKHFIINASFSSRSDDCVVIKTVEAGVYITLNKPVRSRKGFLNLVSMLSDSFCLV